MRLIDPLTGGIVEASTVGAVERLKANGFKEEKPKAKKRKTTTKEN